MDYVAELASRLLPKVGQKPGETAGDPELAADFAARIRAQLGDSDRKVWLHGTDDARRRVLIEILYREPELAVQASMRLEWTPPFIEKLAEEISETSTNRQGRKPFFEKQWRKRRASAGPDPVQLVHEALRRSGVPESPRDWNHELLGRPALTAELARILRLAVPFRAVLNHELDEIEQSRLERERPENEREAIHLRHEMTTLAAGSDEGAKRRIQEIARLLEQIEADLKVKRSSIERGLNELDNPLAPKRRALLEKARADLEQLADFVRDFTGAFQALHTESPLPLLDLLSVSSVLQKLAQLRTTFGTWRFTRRAEHAVRSVSTQVATLTLKLEELAELGAALTEQNRDQLVQQGYEFARTAPEPAQQIQDAVKRIGAEITPFIGRLPLEHVVWLQGASEAAQRIVDLPNALLPNLPQLDPSYAPMKWYKLLKRRRQVVGELEEIEVALRELRKAKPPEENAPAPDDAQAVAVPEAKASPTAGDPLRRAEQLELIGLAFSGGGIRSATFNLGVVQGLAHLDILRHVDFLSTVSGGGYIGAWLAAWAQRKGGIEAVQELLSPENSPNPDAGELRPIRFLREYSNYLTPRRGFFSADTWTMITTWIRNTSLNQLVLVLFLAAILLIPRLASGVLEWGAHSDVQVAIIVVLLLGASIVAARNLRSLDIPPGGWNMKQGWIQALVIVPIFAAAFLTSCLMYQWTGVWSAVEVGAWVFVVLLVALTVIRILARFRGWRLPFDRLAELLVKAVEFAVTGRLFNLAGSGKLAREFLTEFLHILSPLPASAAGAVMAAAIFAWYQSWPPPLAAPGVRWHAISFGTPMLVAVFALTILILVGLLGRELPDRKREWWSRLGAWFSIYILGWTALFAFALYVPRWVDQVNGVISSATGVGWISSTVLGILASRSLQAHPGKEAVRPTWISRVVRVAPYVFVVGLLCAVSVGLYELLVRLAPGAVHLHHAGAYWNSVEQVGYRYSAVALGFVLGAWLILGWRVDVNEFSMHLFYRNRLVRCYLGASRPAEDRKPNLFTGFDSRDEVRLASLTLHDQTKADNTRAGSSDDRPDYVGPYPILNTALNLVKGDDLAWQERKAASFTFSPLYSGYDYAAPSSVKSGLAMDGYRPTICYAYPEHNGINVGTAVAISGAAVSPNMGYHSSPAVAFLMTLFNVRLGWWLGNPRHPSTWMESSPNLGTIQLLAELTGSTSDQSRFVNLSDGGHFENLGIYELVRRRCRYIIACDSEEDAGLTCGGLGNAIRKCRTDLGVDIDIKLDYIRKVDASAHSRSHCVVGTIKYPGSPEGKLVYLKSSLTGDEPVDVLEYAARESAFPHQSTTNQWFGESQFESYRKLGLHVASVAFERATKKPDWTRKAELFDHLEVLWYPDSPAVEKSFARHARTFDDLMERIRKNTGLRFLDHGLYPNLPPAPEPDSVEHLRDEFYTVNALVQLMESVFVDLNLDEDMRRPHNAGWVRIFKGWARHPSFERVWKISRGSYNPRFQHFYEHELRVEEGSGGGPASDAASAGG